MKDRLVLTVLCVFAASCSGSNYEARYEAAEAAYLHGTIERAEAALARFVEYLNDKVGSAQGSRRAAYARALFVTHVRLYDIYAFSGESEKAREEVSRANNAQRLGTDSGQIENMTEQDVIDFLHAIQAEERFIPDWKKQVIKDGSAKSGDGST